MTSFLDAWNVLKTATIELNPAQESPVDLVQVLDCLGIQLHYELSEKPGIAYLTLGRKPKIILNGRARLSQQMTRRDRFSVAHELAHWILWRDLKIPPASNTADYWRQEELCNRFASEFLLPPATLQHFISTTCASPILYPDAIADVAWVTWQVAARALSTHPGTDLAYLRFVATSPSDRFKVDCSSISGKSGSFVAQGAVVWHEDLGKWFGAMREVMINGYRQVFPLCLSIAIGSLQFNKVLCTVSPTANHWIICFQPSSPGVTVVGRPLERPAHISQAHFIENQSDLEEPLRAVQKIAIQAAVHRQALSESDLAVLIGHSFSKISPNHLTKLEADKLLHQLSLL